MSVNCLKNRVGELSCRRIVLIPWLRPLVNIALFLAHLTAVGSSLHILRAGETSKVLANDQLFKVSLV